jgi:epoxyqueuosine reductase
MSVAIIRGRLGEKRGRLHMSTLNKALGTVLRPYYVDYVGFADLTKHQAELAHFGGSIVRGYDSGISIGLAIANAIVDHLPERSDVNVSAEYRIHGYDVLNARLNLIASVVSSFLNRRGFRTLPVAGAETTDIEGNSPTVSHKMIAHIAGMGWIGKNCLLITPDHGPRLRLISLLTNAPFETVDNPLEQRCGDCEECAKICPVKAIKARNYVAGEPREQRLDAKKCRDYFNSMEKTKRYAVCGMCLYACPAGMPQ